MHDDDHDKLFAMGQAVIEAAQALRDTQMVDLRRANQRIRELEAEVERLRRERSPAQPPS